MTSLFVRVQLNSIQIISRIQISGRQPSCYSIYSIYCIYSIMGHKNEEAGEKKRRDRGVEVGDDPILCNSGILVRCGFWFAEALRKDAQNDQLCGAECGSKSGLIMWCGSKCGIRLESIDRGPEVSVESI